MIKGLYAAVSAMLAGIDRQALKTHNLANLDTPGFKQVYTTLQEAQQTEVYSTPEVTATASPQDLGNLGLGVMTTDTLSKFSAGALQSTGQPLDFAIQGNGFFRILTADGERYTRDGRFIHDANGNLVTVDGNKVLDSSGEPIQLTDGELTANSAGMLFIDGAETAQLGVVEFTDPETQLQKAGDNLYQAQEIPDQPDSISTIHQGYLEASNVNVVDMLISAKTYEAAQKMVQTQDSLLGKSIDTLGG